MQSFLFGVCLSMWRDREIGPSCSRQQGFLLRLAVRQGRENEE